MEVEVRWGTLEFLSTQTSLKSAIAHIVVYLS